MRSAVCTGSVSQEMWQDLWPKLPVWEVPITSVTNGVHLPTWLNGDLAQLYDQYLQPDWRERYRRSEDLGSGPRHPEPGAVGGAPAAQAPPDRVCARTQRRQRGEPQGVGRRTCGACRTCWIRTRSPSALLAASPPTNAPRCCSGTWTRLKKILTTRDMPVQIVIAGKAHPKDHPGKTSIREIVQLSRDPELAKHIVFVEDYGIEVARELVQGVDLWLNNPRRGEEACGTSGMKAGINGVLNLSILDGWFDEAYEISGGWAIGDREPYSEDQDEIHARAIYSILENEIVPDVLPVSRRRRSGGLDAAGEAIADAPEPAIQFAADGGRVHVAAL